jgi:hypothetical protein
MNPDESSKRRRADRVTLTREVGVRRAGIQSFRVRVFNSSPVGCKIEFIERPALGERVWVKFDGLEALQGTVQWLTGHIGGVQFARPLHEAVFERLSSTPMTDASERLISA